MREGEGRRHICRLGRGGSEVGDTGVSVEGLRFFFFFFLLEATPGGGGGWVYGGGGGGVGG